MMWLKLRAITLLACFMTITVIGACQPVTGPPLEELLIDEDDLPGEWVLSVEGPQPLGGDAPLGQGFGAIETLVVYFHHPADDGSAGAHEKLLRYRNQSEAEEDYEKMIKTAFSDGFDWYWDQPDFELSQIVSASESLLLCTKGSSEEVCRLVARYGRYLLDLKVDLYGLNSQLEPVRVLTYDNFLEIIDKVEEKMVSVILDEE